MSSNLSFPDMGKIPHAFTGASLKVERAIRHINELETVIEGFRISSDEPFSVTRDADGRYILNFSDLGDEGRKIPLVLGDAIHNLRTALDHVWTALDRAVTGKDETFATFPFDETRQNLVTRIDNSAVQRAFPQVRDLILDYIKPHSTDGGDHVLWSLTKLDKLDKHNILIPTIEIRRVENLIIQIGGEKMSFTDCDFGNIGSLVSSDIAPQYYNNGKITIDPIFPEGFTVSGERVLPTLVYLKEATCNAINLFKSEFT